MECTDGASGNFGGVFLIVTVLLTIAATALLLTAVATDHWEHVTWNHDALREKNVSVREALSGWRLDWLLDGQVVRVTRRRASDAPDDAIFLVPVHGGIWRLCSSLDGQYQHHRTVIF